MERGESPRAGPPCAVRWTTTPLDHTNLTNPTGCRECADLGQTHPESRRVAVLGPTGADSGCVWSRGSRHALARPAPPCLWTPRACGQRGPKASEPARWANAASCPGCRDGPRDHRPGRSRCDVNERTHRPGDHRHEDRDRSRPRGTLAPAPRIGAPHLDMGCSRTCRASPTRSSCCADRLPDRRRQSHLGSTDSWPPARWLDAKGGTSP